MRRAAALAATAALAGTATLPAGCGDGDPSGPGGDPSPAFTLTVTGDVERSLAGDEAAHAEATDPASDRRFWVLVLQTQSGEGEVEGITFLREGGSPGVGTHLLSAFTDPDALPDDATGAAIVLAAAGAEPGFLGGSTGGTLTIASSLGGVVRGAFELDAEGNVFPPGAPAVAGGVAASGEFTALPGAVTLP